ncbi:MAG: ADP-glyceromanno-heptose 6-epimerase [Lewinellaceae bacterium]|nr:ADP-glyceromanno-heptose 6-epimerase [Lewinellaceae bacterium]MCB9291065.1 ADP-glyceromanno-heptose 6-epimerase [Lewinellaceae bacterium]
MIVVTGAAGFIGSCMVRKLNDEGHTDILIVDEFSHEEKNRNLEGKQYSESVHRDDFPAWLRQEHQPVKAIFHIGARTDTTEKDWNIFQKLNLDYSKTLWEWCAANNIPLIYASSAATYGRGECGYDDRHDIVGRLHPLNPYGESKNRFDQWALQQPTAPPSWYGLKFFNVYGPNEYHKGRMASVIFHTVRQIKATGGMKLFRSHRPDYEDGQQSRDFVYVKDVVEVMYWLFRRLPESGLYNLGTGKARSFLDLATNTFRAMGLAPNISFIDTPEDIRDTYQYFTEANMSKLRKAGYEKEFYSLEEGIEDYVKNYLMEEKAY